MASTASNDAPLILIVMGPSGAGKSTVGAQLAQALAWPFLDADSLHPPANVNKMQHGAPLTEDDRRPWLQRVRGAIEAYVSQKQSAVIACSALRRAHREQLRAGLPVQFVYLKGSRSLLEKRLRQRRGHFMPPALLQSQLATLEEPHRAIRVDAGLPVERIVAEVRRQVERDGA